MLIACGLAAPAAAVTLPGIRSPSGNISCSTSQRSRSSPLPGCQSRLRGEAAPSLRLRAVLRRLGRLLALRRRQGGRRLRRRACLRPADRAPALRHARLRQDVAPGPVLLPVGVLASPARTRPGIPLFVSRGFLPFLTDPTLSGRRPPARAQACRRETTFRRRETSFRRPASKHHRRETASARAVPAASRYRPSRCQGVQGLRDKLAKLELPKEAQNRGRAGARTLGADGARVDGSAGDPDISGMDCRAPVEQALRRFPRSEACR